MKRFLKKLFARTYPGWVLFLAYRKAFGMFSAARTGITRNTPEKNICNLRRNIHRLEKGLSFRDPLPVFAESFIHETIDHLAEACSSDVLDEETKYWAVAVLTRYFDHVEATEVIAHAKERFRDLNLTNAHAAWAPYTDDKRPPLRISYDDLLILAKRRRSVRTFTDKKVDPEEIEKAMEIAALAPSACNRQSFRFLFFNEKETVDRIAEIPGGARGYTVPGIVVIVARYDGYFDARDIAAPFIDASLAAMSFEFALETLGLSSVSINWPQSRKHDAKIRELLVLPDDECVVMMIGVGYADPAGTIPYSRKRSLDTLLHINSRTYDHKNER